MNKERIGILIDSIEDQCEYEICQGILDHFSKINVQVIVIEGVHNFKQDDSNEQYIRTINMIKKSNLKGLIILSSFFLDHMKKNDLAIFVESLNNLPIISVGEIIQNVTSIVIDETNSLNNLVDYLLLNKKVTNVAFMFESVTNNDSNRRLNQIISRIDFHANIKINTNIHNFEYHNNKQTKNETLKLLSRSMILPEAIICYDDYIAFGVIDALKSRSINVPEDIIVTGFDDISTNNPFISKLITIKQPFYSVGTRAAITLCKIIEGIEETKNISIDCQNILNRTEASLNLPFGISHNHKIEDIKGIEDFRSRIVTVINMTPGSSMDNKSILTNMLLSMDYMYPVLEQTKLLNGIIEYIKRAQLTVHTLINIRTLLKKCIEYINTKQKEEVLLLSIFSLVLSNINDEIINILANDSYDKDTKNRPTALGGQIMLRSDSLKDLLNKLPDYLETYNFKSFFLFLYKYDFTYKSIYNRDIPLYTELVYGKSESDNNYLKKTVIFKTQDLLPNWELLNCDYNYIFIMLFYNNVPVGYLFVDIDFKINPSFFGIVRINLETALYNILRFEESTEKISMEREYYLNNFNNIKNKVMETENYYDIVAHQTRNNSYLDRLGLSLLGIKSTVNKLFIDDEEMLSMDSSVYTPLLRYFSNKEIKSRINIDSIVDQDELYAKLDPFTMDYIIKKFTDNKNITLDEIKISIFENIILVRFKLELLEDKEIFPEEFNQIKKVLDYCQIPFSYMNNENKTVLTLNLEMRVMLSIEEDVNILNEENSKRILLIGTDKNFIDSMNEVLKSKFVVITSPTLLLATETINMNNSLYLILSDISDQHLWVNIDVKNRYVELIQSGKPVIFLSGNSSRKEMISSLKLGVLDYLKKPISSTEILYKIENMINITTISRDSFINRFEKSLMEVIDSDFSLSDIRFKKVSSFLRIDYNLTPREVEIVYHMVNKLYHRQIATKMNLSEQTVKNISHLIYKKCNVSGKNELINLISTK